MNKTFVFLTLLVVGCAPTTPHLNPPTTNSKFNPTSTATTNHNQIVEPIHTVPSSTTARSIRGFRVGDVIHGFRLGANVATHRQNCDILNGKWDYVGKWCESPTISLSGTTPLFESPTIVAFSLGDFAGTVVKFAYLDETHTTSPVVEQKPTYSISEMPNLFGNKSWQLKRKPTRTAFVMEHHHLKPSSTEV